MIAPNKVFVQTETVAERISPQLLMAVARVDGTGNCVLRWRRGRIQAGNCGRLDPSPKSEPQSLSLVLFTVPSTSYRQLQYFFACCCIQFLPRGVGRDHIDVDRVQAFTAAIPTCSAKHGRGAGAPTFIQIHPEHSFTSGFGLPYINDTGRTGTHFSLIRRMSK
jgi:hypothetical protein